MDPQRLEQLLSMWGEAQPQFPPWSEKRAAQLRARIAQEARDEARVAEQRHPRWLKRVYAAAVLVTIFLAFVIYWPDDSRPTVEMAVVYEERGERLSGDTFHVLLEPVSQPVYVRLVALDDSGAFETLDLDEAGTDTLLLTSELEFPYPIHPSPTRTLLYVVAFSSLGVIQDDQLERELSRALPYPRDRDALGVWAYQLAAKLGASATFIEVPAPRSEY